MEMGEKLGLGGPDLLKFIRESESAAREERLKERGHEKELRDHESKLKDKELEILEQKLKLADKPVPLKTASDEAKDYDLSAVKSDKSAVRVPKLPYFDDKTDDIDSYLSRFEQFANINKWPKSHWAIYLGAHLKGVALEAYTRMPSSKIDNFEEVKDTLLRRFDLTEEGFKRKFRSARPEASEAPQQYIARLRRYMERWLDLAEVEDGDFEQLKDFFIKDQFLHTCPPELAIYLKQKSTNDLDVLAEKAEKFLDARKFSRPVRNENRQNPNTVVKTVDAQHSDRSNNARPQFDSRRSGNTGPKEKPRCYICNSESHRMRDCNFRVQTHAMQQVRDLSEVSLSCARVRPTTMDTSTGNNIIETGSLNIEIGTVNGQQVSVLRDTGCTSVVVKRDLVADDQLLTDTAVCRLIDGTLRRFPIARVQIETPYYTGNVRAICMTDPISDLIVGNIERPPVSSPPENHVSNTVDNGKQDAQYDSQVLKTEVSSEPATIEVMNNVEDEVDTAAAVQTRAQAEKEKQVAKPLKVPGAVEFQESHEEFRQIQERDPELAVFWEKARENKGAVLQKKEAEFIVKDGILYRRFKDRYGYTILQLVLPRKFREKVMLLAHENILAGHMGVKKTYEKISAHFFFPGIGRSVKEWCKTCDQCQRATPKGRNKKVELGQMPIIDVPFKRVSIDIIGKISPCTESKNQYILTLIDFATRFPEAVALPRIDTVTVAEALFTIFTRVGIPEEILSDNGSQLCGGLMEEVMRLLSIKHLVSTVYHPECNGLCENFNGTLKRMLKKVCMERPRDWDRYIPALLFAYRDAPQESLKFSPFCLLYGREVRSPLKIAKELFARNIEEDEVKTTYEYVVDLQNRLKETCEWAHEELSKSQKIQKHYYDRKTAHRSFEPNSLVLLLLPQRQNKLLMQWKGPFKVIKKQSDFDYVIRLKDNKEKLFHINMLKQYFPRNNQSVVLDENVDEGDEVLASVIELDEDEEDSLPETINLTQKETYADVDINPQLPEDKKQELKTLIEEYQDIFTDVPKVTNLGQHKILLTSNIPVKQRAYPIPYALRDEVDKEIDSMLRGGIIEPCDSAYASPLVVVRKPDQSLRLCVNYKKLNSITVFDPEPMPLAADIFAKLANSRYFSKFDMSKGYWQVPMTPEHMDYTSVICHRGLFRFKVMPFGLLNSAACFTRIMRTLTKDLSHTNNYIDDVICNNLEWDDHMIVLRNFFTAVRAGNLSLRPKKCSLGYDSVSFLGYTVQENFLMPKNENIQAILGIDIPKTKKQIRGLIGVLSFYRSLVPHFSDIVLPLTELTKKHSPNIVTWGETQQRAFDTVKHLLCNEPILKLPDCNAPFILQTDASAGGLGATLLQEFDGVRHPVMYASRKLLERETRYPVIERECLAIVWACQKFRNYLYGREFTLEVDHQPLIYLNSAQYRNTRIMRWNLLLQPYKFVAKYIKGQDNIFSDFLSRV